MIESLKIGIQLTVLGMGLVFLVLALLWGLTALMLRLDRAPANTNAAASSIDEEPEPDGETGLEPDLIAAISVAVLTHQAVRRKQAAPAMRSHRPGELPSRWVGAGRTRQTRSWTPSRR